MRLIYDLDEKFIRFCKRAVAPLARVALFLVYFWFGILKITGDSPANPLVMDLQQKTLPFLTFDRFILGFAVFEMLIGVLFLFPKFTKLVFVLFILHMGMTLMPLVLVPQVAWQGPFVPTLEGQYMIKNIVLIALAVSLLAGENQTESEKLS